MNGLFSSPKKLAVTILCVVIAALVIASAGLLLLKGSLISAAEAEFVALSDAGLTRGQVSALRSDLDFDDGRWEYNVDFYSDGVEYDYAIQAKDGGIISRDIDGQAVAGQPNDTTQPAVEQPADMPQPADTTQPVAEQPAPATTPGAPAQTTPQPAGNNAQQITLDDAKAAALKDAGLAAADVTFTKAKLDYDDGVAVYEVEFYSADTEYEYEINATGGTVRSRSAEALPQNRRPATSTPAASGSTADGHIGAEKAKAAALKDAGLAAADVTFTKAKLDYDDGVAVYEVEFYSADTEYEYEINATGGTVRSRSAEALPQSRRPAASTPATSGSTSTTSDGHIGAEKAKAAALKDAGLAAADVTFTKAKLDYDDGVAVYEVEFYSADTEYEYEINATGGTVRSRSAEALPQSRRPAASTTTAASGSTASGHIGAEKAKAAALKDAGLAAADVTFTKAKLDYDDGRAEYEVEFYYGAQEYEYTIDAETGAIIEAKKDRD